MSQAGKKMILMPFGYRNHTVVDYYKSVSNQMKKTGELRAYTRHRKKLLAHGADSVRRIQEYMELMNLKQYTVISDIYNKNTSVFLILNK